MTGSVIRRLGYTISDAGRIDYQQEIATWADADALAGRRVDRRRCYAIFDSGTDAHLCEVIHWTARCSGCSDGYRDCLGCQECGYRGVRRNSAWVPMAIRAAAPEPPR